MNANGLECVVCVCVCVGGGGGGGGTCVCMCKLVCVYKQTHLNNTLIGLRGVVTLQCHTPTPSKLHPNLHVFPPSNNSLDQSGFRVIWGLRQHQLAHAGSMQCQLYLLVVKEGQLGMNLSHDGQSSLVTE